MNWCEFTAHADSDFSLSKSIFVNSTESFKRRKQLYNRNLFLIQTMKDHVDVWCTTSELWPSSPLLVGLVLSKNDKFGIKFCVRRQSRRPEAHSGGQLFHLLSQSAWPGSVLHPKSRGRVMRLTQGTYGACIQPTFSRFWTTTKVHCSSRSQLTTPTPSTQSDSSAEQLTRPTIITESESEDEVWLIVLSAFNIDFHQTWNSLDWWEILIQSQYAHVPKSELDEEKIRALEEHEIATGPLSGEPRDKCFRPNFSKWDTRSIEADFVMTWSDLSDSPPE